MDLVSNMDRSLEKINYIKLLIFLLVFVFITLLLILTLILPNIKKYRTVRAQYNKVNVYKTRVENVLHERVLELKKLETKNRKIFAAFKHEFSQKEFVSFASKFFHKVSLKEAKQKTDGKEYKVYELNVTSSLKTPVNFYKFLDGLNHYQNMVQADFPIELRADRDMIYSSFKIKVYGVKDLKKK